MKYNASTLTLGLLLSSEDATIKRNATSILKIIQKCDHRNEHGACIYCFRPAPRTKDLTETKETVFCERCGSKTKVLTHRVQDRCTILESEKCPCGYEWNRTDH